MGTTKRNGLIVVGITVIIIVCLSLALLLPKSSPSMLPPSLQKQAKDFTPYFFEGSIPAGYRLNESQATYDNKVLITPLSRPNGPTITITQQPMPSKLSENNLLANGEKLQTDAGPATLNDVEGRFVGTIITHDPKVLIIINTPNDTNKSDVSALMRGLVKL
jgi:hypothetical protein